MEKECSFLLSIFLYIFVCGKSKRGSQRAQVTKQSWLTGDPPTFLVASATPSTASISPHFLNALTSLLVEGIALAIRKIGARAANQPVLNYWNLQVSLERLLLCHCLSVSSKPIVRPGWSSNSCSPFLRCICLHSRFTKRTERNECLS